MIIYKNNLADNAMLQEKRQAVQDVSKKAQNSIKPVVTDTMLQKAKLKNQSISAGSGGSKDDIEFLLEQDKKEKVEAIELEKSDKLRAMQSKDLLDIFSSRYTSSANDSLFNTLFNGMVSGDFRSISSISKWLVRK